MTRPTISVLVCTYNRASMLREALESVARQHLIGSATWELLVVDNGSTDNTAEVVAEFSAAYGSQVRSFYEPRPGVAAARNRAVSEAQGEWVAFLDDDELAEPDWLETLYSFATLHGVPCIAGAVKLKLPADVVTPIPAAIAGVLGATPPVPRPMQLRGRTVPGTGNVLIRRDLFKTVGAFDETLVEAGEDNDFFRRVRAAGHPLWRTPHAIVQHIIPAERLLPKALRSAAMRTGWYLGRIQTADHGVFWAMGQLIVRTGYAAVVYVPRWLYFTSTGNRPQRLAACCNLWRYLGFATNVLHRICPSWFSAQLFRRAHDFREARSLPS